MKPIQFLWCFFACVVVVFVRFGGGKLLIQFVSLNRTLKGCATEGCFSGLDELDVSMDLIRVISVYCVQLGVLWRFSRLVVMGVSIVWVAYMYIFLDQRFTNHVHVASYSTVSSHFYTPFTQQNAPQCEPAFSNPVHVVNTLRCQVK